MTDSSEEEEEQNSSDSIPWQKRCNWGRRSVTIVKKTVVAVIMMSYFNGRFMKRNGNI